jgi:hypothetical protein
MREGASVSHRRSSPAAASATPPPASSPHLRVTALQPCSLRNRAARVLAGLPVLAEHARPGHVAGRRPRRIGGVGQAAAAALDRRRNDSADCPVQAAHFFARAQAVGGPSGGQCHQPTPDNRALEHAPGHHQRTRPPCVDPLDPSPDDRRGQAATDSSTSGSSGTSSVARRQAFDRMGDHLRGSASRTPTSCPGALASPRKSRPTPRRWSTARSLSGARGSSGCAG